MTTLSEDRYWLKYPEIDGWQIMVGIQDENELPQRIKDQYHTNLPVNWVGVTKTNVITSTGLLRSGVLTVINSGKNIGRKNETNPFTQAINVARGKYKSRIHHDTPPMLVKNYNDAPIKDYSNLIIQRKYNGIRGVAYLQDDDSVKIYSRKGLAFTSIDHIKDEIKIILKRFEATNTMRGAHIDGELYKHGLPLSEISGIVRSGRINDEKLSFYIFDVFWPNKYPIAEIRRRVLHKLFKHKSYQYLQLVEGIEVSSHEEIMSHYQQFLDEGYEGAIVRKLKEQYEYGTKNYHSSHVLKLKPKMSAEFPIINFKDGRGKDDGLVIWIARTADGKEFSVVPNLTQEERRRIFTEISADSAVFDRNYKNQQLTVEYMELSQYGVPTQPKGVAIRNYE